MTDASPSRVRHLPVTVRIIGNAAYDRFATKAMRRVRQTPGVVSVRMLSEHTTAFHERILELEVVCAAPNLSAAQDMAAANLHGLRGLQAAAVLPQSSEGGVT